MFCSKLISRPAIRRFTTSALRRSHDEHDVGGIPGENMPFSINNRYKLTLLFTVFLGSGFGLPFITVRHQMLKA